MNDSSISAFSSTESRITTSSRDATTTSSKMKKFAITSFEGNPSQSASGISASSRGVQSTYTLTSSDSIPSWALTNTSFSSKSDIISLSTNHSMTVTATETTRSTGSASTPLYPGSSSHSHLPSNTTSSATRANLIVMPPFLSMVSSESTTSQTVTSGEPSRGSAASTTETSLPAKQTSISLTSTPFTKSTNATSHSNPTLMASQASNNASLSLVSSSASTSNPSHTSMTTSTLFFNQHIAASSVTFSISTNGASTTRSQIAIPTTTMGPNNAAAIAGGVAIGEGLALLYAKFCGIPDIAGLKASKTEMLNSIQTF